MSDRPAAWLTDPTGRHDHRYWDGTRWTDHVADAGVAATDAYDGPAGATPDAEPTGSESATTTETTTDASPSGWAATGDTAEATPTQDTAAEAAPAAGATFSVSGWGAGDEPDADDAGGTDTSEADTDIGATPLAAGSYWDRPSPSTTTGEADAEAPEADDDDATVAEVSAPTWGASPSAAPATATWGAATTPAPTPTSTWGAPGTIGTTTEEPPPDKGSRKGLLLAVAIGAIVAIVIALVITGDDEGDDGAGSSFAAQFSEQLQSQSQVSEDQADCVGEYVVDEIGASRLESLRALEDRTAPPELQEDFDQAVQRALTECEVDQQDLIPDSSTDGGASDGLSAEVTAPSQVMTEAQYEDYYKTSLGLNDEDAKCLAERSAEAEASGEIEEGDGISQFYQWVDECGIDPDELFQTIATADAGTTG